MSDPQAGALNPDDYARVIILIYGVLENDAPFWCYVAVKPSQYQPFLDAQKDGSLNLYEFERFGEVIVSGEGNEPPEAVTLKVAEVYQTDPKTFFQPMDPEAEIARRMKEVEKGGSAANG
jgi:hypothetical protein